MQELFLAEHARASRIAVDEVISSVGDELVVAAGGEARQRLRLFGVDDPVFVLQASATALRSVVEPGHAAAFVGRSLAGGEAVAFDGFNEAQQRALGSTLAPGVNVIWGPPGTGKTRVIVEALRRILESGGSALLVSNTNVAVDQALERAWAAAGGPGPGVMVRVGHPSLSSVGAHDWLPLAKAREHLGGQHTVRLREIERRTAELERHPDLVRLAEERRAVGGVSLGDIEAARTRIADGDRLAAVEAAVVAAARNVEACSRALDDANAALEAAAVAMKDTEPARVAWRRVRSLTDAAESRQLVVDEVAGSVDRLRCELAALDERPC